jgi:hypothetical protein
VSEIVTAIAIGIGTETDVDRTIDTADWKEARRANSALMTVNAVIAKKSVNVSTALEAIPEGAETSSTTATTLRAWLAANADAEERAMARVRLAATDEAPSDIVETPETGETGQSERAKRLKSRLLKSSNPKSQRASTQVVKKERSRRIEDVVASTRSVLRISRTQSSSTGSRNDIPFYCNYRIAGKMEPQSDEHAEDFGYVSSLVSGLPDLADVAQQMHCHHQPTPAEDLSQNETSDYGASPRCVHSQRNTRD